MEKCLFCKIIRGDSKSYKIYESANCFAFLDTHPIASGHVLVVPKKHEVDILELEPDIYKQLWESVKEIAVNLRTAINSKRIGIAVEGFTVPHVHIHLVPVNNADELDPNRAHRESTDGLQRIHKKILMSFQNGSK